MASQFGPTGSPPAPAPPNVALRPPLGIQVLPPAIALIEIIVLIVPITLLDHHAPWFPNLAEFQPHPFWLPVLLLSLQYGTLSGLIAASVAILGTLYIGWPQQDVGENHFTYLLRVWTQPALWIGSALVLGQFRLRQIERKLELQRLVAELTTQRNAIADFSTNLRARCDALERHIASRPSGVARDAVGALADLAASGRDGLRPALARAIEAAIGPSRSALFVNAGDGLALEASTGQGDEQPRSRRLDPADPLHRALVVEGRVLSVLSAGDERVLAGRGLVAVPIIAATSDRVIGALMIEGMETRRLDAHTPERLRLLAAILAPLLQTHAGVRILATPAAARPQPAPAKLWRRLLRHPAVEAPVARSDVPTKRNVLPR